MDDVHRGVVVLVVVFFIVRLLRSRVHLKKTRRKDARKAVPPGRRRKQRGKELFEDIKVAESELTEEIVEKEQADATTIDGDNPNRADQFAAYHQSATRAADAKGGSYDDYRQYEVTSAIMGRQIGVALGAAFVGAEAGATVVYHLKGGGKKAGKAGAKVAKKALAKKAAAAAGAKGAKTAGKAAVKKVMAKMTAKLIKSTAKKLAGAALRAGAKLVGSLLFSAATGPVGIAMFVMDLVTLTLDVLDLGGYSNFTPNEMLHNIRNAQEAMMRNLAKQEGVEYPFNLGPGYVFPTQMAKATRIVNAQNETRAFDEIQQEFFASKQDQMVKLYEQAMSMCDGDPERVEAVADDLLHEHIFKDFNPTEDEILERMYSTGMTPLKRDQLILEELNKLLGFASRKYVMLAPWRSSVKESGITLTLAGARWWNERHKADWYEYFDLFFPRMDPEAYEGEQAVAIHSDTYRVRDEADPGPDEAPNMKEKKLPGKMTFMLYMPQVVSFCEAKRQVGIMGTRAATNNGVDPKKFGVRFDETLGMCKLTQRYCSRFGADYHASKHFGAGECEVGAGQEFAESIFGETIVKGVSQLIDLFEGSIGREPKCREGTKFRIFGVKGKAPGCYEDNPCPDGTYAIESLDGDYTCKYDRGIGTLPPADKKEPCPAFATDTGTDCWNSGGRGLGYSITANEIGKFFAGGGRSAYDECKDSSDAKNRVDYDNELRKKDPFGKECKYVPNNDGLTPGHQKICLPYRPGTGGRGKKCWTKPHDDDRVMYRRPYAELKEPVLADDGKTKVCLKEYHCEKWRYGWEFFYPPCPMTMPVDVGANICGKAPLDIGISANVFDRARCHDDREPQGGLCYKKAKPGFTCGMTYCTSRGRIGKRVGRPDVCDDGWVIKGGRCKPK